jgi:alpha-galactosidase
MNYALSLLAFLAALTNGPTPRTMRAAPADKPPMGWNSWNKFGCKIDEKLIDQTADAMVAVPA